VAFISSKCLFRELREHDSSHSEHYFMTQEAVSYICRKFKITLEGSCL